MSLSRVVLSSGRTVELSQLRMSSTYGGMLEGYPCKRINDMKLRGVRAEAEQAFSFAPVHLVAPLREYPERTAGAFGPVEVLPSVVCTGVFRSAAVAPDLDEVLHRSALIVIWFQPVPDVPSGEDADPALRDMPWEELARDYEL
ncbi:hypothetical protein ACFWFU_00200 [Streptomyces sp. NPDC060235]|uniref:hypothetical protein n=1 Tax=unclassified Streptomyces TaxID=2593676 RepID=UPI0036473E15